MSSTMQQHFSSSVEGEKQMDRHKSHRPSRRPRRQALWLLAAGAISAAAALLAPTASACTVIAIGRNATADGSTLIAHTDDAGGGAADVRLVRVPAQRHPAGSKRPVYNFAGGFPRLVARERGEHYAPRDDSPELQQPMAPLGFIPQVPRTYAYFDQDYGMMNEVQLSIGESTCGAKTVGWPLDAGAHGKNLFGIAELSKVALERCASARCAVRTMGELAVEYGFYSEDSGDPASPDFGDSAEALVVADKFGEVWLFHVLTGPNNASAVWAAQRVPETHATALANGFVIRELDLADPDWFLASPNVESFAREMGWWDPARGAPFDFTAAYGVADKDAIGPLYTGRRIWRVFDVLAPSLALDARLGSVAEYRTYPLSVAPDAKVELATVLELLRDHYEGTPFDLTKGIAAGPFGSPVRWGGASQGVPGGWERPISMYRTLFSFVLQVRGALPDAVGGVAWYGQSAPHGSVFVPFACAQTDVPAAYLAGKQSAFDPRSAWWAFSFVNNWSLLRFNAINQDVRREAGALQREAFAFREALDARALEAVAASAAARGDGGAADADADDAVRALLTAESNAFATRVVDHWWQFAWRLVAKFSDGYVTTGEAPGQMQAPGYPAWWLELSEFSKWPGDSFAPKHEVRARLEALGATTALIGRRDASAHAATGGALHALAWLGAGFVLGAAALALAQRHQRAGYTPLP